MSKSMSRPQLTRRALLKGAAAGGLVLPWLELAGESRTSHAAAPPPRRFLTVYQPGGSVLEQWQSTGTETEFELGPILRSLQAFKQQLLVFEGIDMKSAVGEQDQAGMVALLTGTPQATESRFASGPSLDQVLATHLSAEGRPIPSLELAVRWGTGKSHGLLSPMNCLNYRDNDTFDPITPRLDPVQIWNELFAGPLGPEAAATWDRSMLDAVAQRYESLALRLGAADKRRLEQHLEALRALEQQVATVSRCAAPQLIDTSDYDPAAGLASSDNGSVRDLVTDAAIPKVGRLMMDMLVMAFACDLTAIGTFQWSDCEAKHTFPWLDLPETYAYYQNDGGYRPVECAAIGTWHADQLGYLLTQLNNVDLGGHSLLDETVVFYGSHLQNVATHTKNNMPFLLAGGGGALRTGRLLRYPDRSHNDLLLSIANLFGDRRTTFGAAQYCQGPLDNLV